MLFRASQDSIKSVFQFLAKVPFSKYFLHRLSELARGKCIAYFTVHRILDDTPQDRVHPHYLNKTAITIKQAQRALTHLNRHLPFITLADSLHYLMGRRSLTQSSAVLLIEVPYVKTVRLIKPLLEDLKIPATIVLNTESLSDGRMPWMDEIVYRVANAKRQELAVNFIDRSFRLISVADRISAANHLIEHISHAKQSTLVTRLNQLREALPEVAVPEAGERICSMEQIDKLSLNPLFSFISGGKSRLPLYDITLLDAKTEIIDAMAEQNALLCRSFFPVFFNSFGIDKRRHHEIIKLMMENGLQAAISKAQGVCRPGDNMFRLTSLPLNSKSFAQFEMQGIANAVDEFLLVTLAKDEEL